SAITAPARSAAAAGPLTAGTPGYLGMFVDSNNLGNSSLFQSGPYLGQGTTAPKDAMHVAFTDAGGVITGYAVQNLSGAANAYSGMLFYDQNGALGQFQGFNNTTHEYRINNIASGGTINFLIGSSSKFKVATNGSNNTAVGYAALVSTDTGGSNAAVGYLALAYNTTGSSNSAFGALALNVNNGLRNTAIGYAALMNSGPGNDNIAVGNFAGSQVFTESNNIEIGSIGDGMDSGAIRIGTPGTQTSFFAAGVRGVTRG